MKWYVRVLTNYAVFSGRATRQEYWMFSLFHLLFSIVTIMLDLLLDTTVHFSTAGGYENLPYGAIYLLYILALAVPTLAVTVRRLHDTGSSGACIFLALIPVIGTVWLFVLLVSRGEYRKNRFGDLPGFTHAIGALSYTASP